MTQTQALIDALEIIVANAKIIPDPGMEGLTDAYSVPLDDIENAQALLQRIIRPKAA